MSAGIMVPSICLFAFLASVTLIQCAVAGEESFKAGSKPVVRFERASSYKQLLPSGLTPSELLDTSEGFLAGETTPVFTSFKQPGKPVVYTRVHKDYVKRAVDWWLSNSKHKGYGNATRPSGSTQTVLYPSVLAVLDYDGGITENYKGSQDIWIKEGILYALSFWNGIDLQLRYVSDPAVRIRLAGIILGKNREATPYIHENLDEDGWIDAEQAIVPMMAYWRNLIRSHPDFNSMVFDTVVTMTGAIETGVYDSELSEPTAADTRSICSRKPKAINGFIVHDNLAYRGIQPAVHSMARTLGATRGEGGCSVNGTMMQPSYGYPFKGYERKWAACSLAEISNYLSEHGSCMSSPKEYYNPGKPVPGILPGKFQSVKDQCETIFSKKMYDCFPRMKDAPCGTLLCSPDEWNARCTIQNAFVPDGSSCDVGFSENGRKICLDSKCVNDPLR